MASRRAKPRLAMIREPFSGAMQGTTRRLIAASLLVSLAFGRLAAQAAGPTSPASVSGLVTDGFRGGVLEGAFVELLPGSRQAMTDSAGRFRFGDVPPRDDYYLRVVHARIDTLGISLTTPPFAVRASESKREDIGIPSASRLVTLLCTAAQLSGGAAALVGFVRDPDTGAVPDSIVLSLVYDESPLAALKLPVIRVVHANAAGRYAICGLPTGISARIQLSRGGLASSDIPVATDSDAPLTLRAFGWATGSRRVVTQANGRGAAPQLVRGDARVTGRVVSKSTGLPIVGARIQMDGTLAAAVSTADGSFSLDSVPTGTQVISARKLGYGVTDAAVDVVRYGPAFVVVAMPDAAQVLARIVTVAQRTRDLDAVGFTRRKALGIGTFREGEEVDQGPTDLGESLRMMPGLHIGYGANSQSGQKTVIMSSRDANECVNFFIDGVVWQDSSSAIEEYVRPEEIEALEMYSSATVPGEFVVGGKSKCAVLVIWTKRRIHRTPAPD